jgi:hypothetical protein
VLLQELHPDIYVVGTDFFEQSLLSKVVDLVFCNPPFSQFEAWVVKLIKESVCKKMYLVLPQRWEKNQAISDALHYRSVKADVVASFDFLESEDRPARAQVDLICVSFETSSRYYSSRVDPDSAFDLQFYDQFSDFVSKFKPSEKVEDLGECQKEKLSSTDLVVGEDYPTTMVNLYLAEMGRIQTNYKLMTQLDVGLLREFEIFPNKVLACLKQRLRGLRNHYWNELFNRIKPITEKLTSATRTVMLNTLQKNVHVDFTVPNIHAVVMWALKNFNKHVDEQLIVAYELMIKKANVHLYKSNHKLWVEDSWSYKRESPENQEYYLDYRIVVSRVGGMRRVFSGDRRSHALDDSASDFIEDMRTIASNLGFTRFGSEDAKQDTWNAGKSKRFYFLSHKTNKPECLMEVRAFKNRNLHIKFNQRFMLALNVEFGRLKGWIKSGQHAVEELQNKEAAEFFKSNFQIVSTNSMLQLTA